jgi:microcystin-dependent protein
METYIGMIALFPYSFVPEGWALCSGQLLPISQNQALYSLLGATYGGDERSTFGLPNLVGKEPAPHLRYCIALQGIYPMRS